MPSRQRVVMTISVPPQTAEEYKEIAMEKGETLSGFFREMFSFYKQERLTKEFRAIQSYGIKKAREMKITEKEIEKLIFAGR